MSIKDLLVLCDASEANDYRVETAFSLAKVFDAHVTGIHLIPYPMIPVYGPVFPPYSAALQLEVADNDTKMLETKFLDMASDMKVSSTWKVMEGIDIDYVIDNARYADLVVTPQYYSRYGECGPQRLNDFFTVRLGRPLMVIPDLKKVHHLPHNIIIAWNESHEATRAVHDALPLLSYAENIQVVSVSKNDDEEKACMIYCEDLREHLGHHGIQADVISPKKSDKGTGNTILGSALEYDADLIVMGAYGHSRFKEIILGGATKYLLDNATIPLFLSS